MNRLSQLVGLGFLSLTLLVGVGVSQDTKKDDKKEEKKSKGYLPPGFKDLGLSATQLEKVRSINADYKAKISELDKQIKSLKKQEQQEFFKVLTDEQRERYLKSKGLDVKDKKDKGKEPEKTKEPEKK